MRTARELTRYILGLEIPAAVREKIEEAYHLELRNGATYGEALDIVHRKIAAGDPDAIAGTKKLNLWEEAKCPN